MHASKPSGRRISAGGNRQRYNTAKRKRDKEQAELQDLLVDPQYDALFDGIGEAVPGKDPFASSGAKGGGGGRELKAGRPSGSARTKARSDGFEDASKAKKDGEDDDPDSYFNMWHKEEEEIPSTFETHLKYQRFYYLQQQQEEVMEIHHNLRASDISQYAQSTVLARLMGQYEQMDEWLQHRPPVEDEEETNPWLTALAVMKDPDLNRDNDPLPSWMRAKRLMAKNWSAVEKFAGNREETVERIYKFSRNTEERQHLLDTFDPSLYEGVEDSAEKRPDYLDNYLVLSEETSDMVPADSNDFVNELMADLDDLDE